jgi:hypothetical protein
MKTVRLTESSIRRIVEDAVRQITAGGTAEGELDVPAFEIDRDIKKLVKIMDDMAEAYIDKSEDTGEQIYERFASRLFSLTERLDKFMDDEGYDMHLRKRDGEF